MFQELQILTFFQKATSLRASLLSAQRSSGGNLAILDVGVGVKEDPIMTSDNTMGSKFIGSHKLCLLLKNINCVIVQDLASRFGHGSLLHAQATTNCDACIQQPPKCL